MNYEIMAKYFLMHKKNIVGSSFVFITIETEVDLEVVISKYNRCLKVFAVTYRTEVK